MNVGDKVIEKNTGKECEVVGFVGERIRIYIPVTNFSLAFGAGLCELVSKKRFEEEYKMKHSLGCH